MEIVMNKKEARTAVVKVLESKGYNVQDESKGSGIPKNSRLKLERDGKTQRAVVKFANMDGPGRISFPRDGSGGFKVIPDFDLVIYVRPDTTTTCEVLAFDRSTIQNAFLETNRLLQAEGNDSYEIWLSPDKEQGTRFHGSGYRSAAIWSDHYDEGAEPEDSGQPNLIEELKAIASSRLSISPDKISIEVKITA